jgi:hypothetical protein
VPPSTASARTFASAAGAHGSSAPVCASKAASRDRATFFPPALALVKFPPT